MEIEEILRMLPMLSGKERQQIRDCLDESDLAIAGAAGHLAGQFRLILAETAVKERNLAYLLDGFKEMRIPLETQEIRGSCTR
jgi:hypothetical protein